MSANLVYAVHGFLGCSSDWDEIKWALPELNFVAEELFSEKESIGTDFISQFKGKKIFLGYSLGGRIGLQILKKTPELFDHYIFLSTNPGFSAKAIEERKNRILNDQKWSEKINTQNWSNFLKEWNEQPVFKGSKVESKRDINKYDLDKLKTGIVKWSLGVQEDFSETIQMNNNKITWVVGDLDKKYTEIADHMKNKKILLSYQTISSGHRIWLDNPMAIVEVLKQVLI